MTQNSPARRFFVNHTILWTIITVVTAFILSLWFVSFNILVILLSLAGMVMMQGMVEGNKFPPTYNSLVSPHVKPIISLLTGLTYCAFASEFVLLLLHQDFVMLFAALVIEFSAAVVIGYLLIKRFRIMTQSSTKQIKKV